MTQIRAILRLEWVSLMAILVFALIFLVIALGWIGRPHLERRLSYTPVDTFMMTPIFSGAVLLFPGVLATSSNWTFKSQGVEFPFSLPISRALLFWGKSAIYFLGCLVAPAIIWIYSSGVPALRLQLPYQPEQRALVEQFYSQTFVGVEVVKTKDLDMLIIPQAEANRALFRLFVTAACVAVMQLIAVFTMGSRWGNQLLCSIFLFPLGLGLVSFSRSEPSFYERAIALVANHGIAIALAGGIVILGLQLICMRSFCRTDAV